MPPSRKQFIEKKPGEGRASAIVHTPAEQALFPLHCNLQYAATTTSPFSLAKAWHRLSLDAPTVAFVWCCFFARAAHVELPWVSPFLLALGTWIVYVADRLLDGLRLSHEPALRERHYFYARHRTAFCGALAIATVLCLSMTVAWARRDVLAGDCLLGALVGLYFLLIHGVGRSVERWFPKELVVGTLFAAATALPAFARMHEYFVPFASAVGLFAGLCWLNCVAIEHWETRSSKPVEAVSHFTTRAMGKHLDATGACLAGLSVACAIFGSQNILLKVALASFLGNIGLVFLNHFRGRLSSGVLRVAADISLLTPLVMFPWMGQR